MFWFCVHDACMRPFGRRNTGGQIWQCWTCRHPAFGQRVTSNVLFPHSLFMLHELLLTLALAVMSLIEGIMPKQLLFLGHSGLEICSQHIKFGTMRLHWNYQRQLNSLPISMMKFYSSKAKLNQIKATVNAPNRNLEIAHSKCCHGATSFTVLIGRQFNT